jgi:hypothetical protein
MQRQGAKTVVSTIARGRQWLNDVVSGRVTTVVDLGARENCSVRQVSMTISLAFLAPNLVKAAVEGRLPRGVGIERLRVEYGLKRARTSCPNLAAGNGIFGCRDGAPKIAGKAVDLLQRQKPRNWVPGNPARNALFGVVPESCGLRRLGGGRTRARTWDPMIKSHWSRLDKAGKSRTSSTP